MPEELDPLYQPGVPEALDKIENDPERHQLWNNIVNTLRLICTEPGSAEAHRYEIKTMLRETVWRVPVRSGTEDQNYAILWNRSGSDAVIHYVGIWPPPSSRP